jgi:hypothetical protein
VATCSRALRVPQGQQGGRLGFQLNERQDGWAGHSSREEAVLVVRGSFGRTAAPLNDVEWAWSLVASVTALIQRAPGRANPLGLSALARQRFSEPAAGSPSRESELAVDVG